MAEKMIDVGVERERGDITQSVPSVSAGKNYPVVRRNDKKLPFLKDHSVGDMIELVVQYKITGVREAEAWDDIKGANYYDGELRKVGLKSAEAEE